MANSQDTPLNPKVPKYFPCYDIRRKPEDWFEEAISTYLSNIFAPRFTAEQTMSLSQLKAFDYQILKHLDKNNVKEGLMGILRQEYEQFTHMKGGSIRDTEYKGANFGDRTMPDFVQQHSELSRLIKNKDALLKRFAYEMALWKKEHEIPEYRRVFFLLWRG